MARSLRRRAREFQTRFSFHASRVALLTVLAFALSTCDSSSDDSPTGPTGPVQSAIVNLLTNNTFSPSTVTIVPGGTVTFVNLGGEHNVMANDGSFRCANGCDDSGGDGDPATNAWSVTITFPNAGSVPYNCEVHVLEGMTGTVIVQ